MLKTRRFRRYKRKPRKVCTTEAGKAKALQVAWRFATDRQGTLTLVDARKIVSDPPVCPYCHVKIPYWDISIDHKQPRSRGGTSLPENLVFCDKLCNQAKGNLTEAEFTSLMDFLGPHSFMKMSVLQRLVSSGRVFGRRFK